MLCAVFCKILSAGTDLLSSDSYFSRVTQVNFPVPFFFSKTKMVGMSYIFLSRDGELSYDLLVFFMLQSEDFSTFLKKGLYWKCIYWLRYSISIFFFASKMRRHDLFRPNRGISTSLPEVNYSKQLTTHQTLGLKRMALASSRELANSCTLSCRIPFLFTQKKRILCIFALALLELRLTV